METSARKLRLKAAWQDEMGLGNSAFANGDMAVAFGHFERAHILGQRMTWLHVRAHCGMLRIGWSRRDGFDIAGQLLRIIAAVLMSRIWVPAGNTGGSNVSAMQRMPVPDDLRRILDA
jgi:hypothetical protein